MNRRFFLAAATIFGFSPAFAEAPIYFDLGGPVLVGAGALLLFVFLLVVAARTKSPGIRILCLIGLGAYVAVPMLQSTNAHRVRKSGENWTLFERERHNLSVAASSTLVDLCRKAVEQRPLQKIQGFRLLSVEHLPGVPARGWRTGADFFIGGTTYAGRIDTPATVVQALQNSMRQLSKQSRSEARAFPFVEYQSPDGNWKRFEVPPGGLTYEEHDAPDIRASHGLRIAQIKTGTETQYTIYAGSIEVTDLATGVVVGKHLSYTADRYWEAHNHYALFPNEHCKGLPLGVDFLTDWLRPLVF